MSKTSKMKRGMYLVIDPSLEEETLLRKLSLAVQEPLAAVQIWDHFQKEQNIPDLIQKIASVCHEKGVPVLMNNRWEYLQNTWIDGVHFDEIPPDFLFIKQTIGKSFLAGVTCNNDLRVISRADELGFDYISFCSLFPSATSNSCELVRFDSVIKAKSITSLPIFLAGGITPENLVQLNSLSYDGIAVISGIMGREQPNESVRRYYKHLKSFAI